MIRPRVFAIDGIVPVIDPSAYVHPSAVLIGDVIVGPGCYVGPCASLRGDFGRLILERGVNVQDTCVMHGFPGTDTIIEEDGHIGHGAVLHGCRIGRNALVGMNAVIMDNAVVGESSIVAACAFVKAGMAIPPRSLVAGVPAKVMRAVSDQEIAWKSEGTLTYQNLTRRSLATLVETEALAAVEPDRKRFDLPGVLPLIELRKQAQSTAENDGVDATADGSPAPVESTTPQKTQNSDGDRTADLFQPYTLGTLTLSNRIVMAPLTRCRALAGDIPGPLAATYYGQRASAGLIISEASQISPQGKGYLRTPGIYNARQIAGWRQVTDAVHQRGGHIFMQLWHVGRISHPALQIEHALPVAPSAIRPTGRIFTGTATEEMVTPRALDLADLPGIIDDYHRAAQHARLAGFDGVEIHAANGYLLDQFLRDKTNRRDDAYGGSIENRSRLLLEVIDAVLTEWEEGRVGVRLSPLSTVNDIDDSNPAPLFSHVVQQLASRQLGFVHLIEGITAGSRLTARDFDLTTLRALFAGTWIVNNGYTRAMALSARAAGHADLISFGRSFIANPDLVERLGRDAPLNSLDPATLYAGGERGYTDYPFLSAAVSGPSPSSTS